MSRYIKLDDAIDVASKECHEFRGIFGRIEDGINALPTIEVSEDCISRKWLEEHKKVISYTNEWRETGVDSFVFWETIENAPSVVPSRAEGEWIVSADGDSICSVCGESEEWFIYGTENWYGKGYSKYCPNCGAKMRGAKKWNNVQNVEDI